MKKNLDVRVPKGVRLQLRELTDGSWAWTIWLWTARVAEGQEKTKMLAEKALKTAIGTHLLKVSKSAQEKATLRSKVKEWCRKRPHVSAYFFEAFARGLDLSAIVENAVTGEKDRWDHDKTPSREPLPTHHLAKSAGAVVVALHEALAGLGWSAQRAESFAKGYFGSWYDNPEGDFSEGVEVVPLRKSRLKENETSEDYSMGEDSPV